jgi:uncharacterized protein (TIGR02246 family)
MSRLICSSIWLMLIALIVSAGCQRQAAPQAKLEAKQAPAPDRNALNNQRAVLGDAFNRGDAKTWASVYADDADFIHESGDVLRGPAEIEKGFAKGFADNPGLRVNAVLTEERFLTPEIVLEDGTWRVTGARDDRATEGRWTAVWMFRDGKWRVVSHRGWIPWKPKAPD